MNQPTDHKWLNKIIPIIEAKAEDDAAKKKRQEQDQQYQLKSSLYAIMGVEASDQIVNNDELPSHPSRYRLGDYEFGGASSHCSTGFYLYLRLPIYLDNGRFSGSHHELMSGWIDDLVDLANAADNLSKSLDTLLDDYRAAMDRETAKALKENVPTHIPQIEGGSIADKSFLNNLLAKIENGERLTGRYAAAMHLIAAIKDMSNEATEIAQSISEDDYDDQGDDDN